MGGQKYLQVKSTEAINVSLGWCYSVLVVINLFNDVLIILLGT